MYSTLISLYSSLETLTRGAWDSLAPEVTRLDAEDRLEQARAPEVFFTHGPQLLIDVERELPAELMGNLELGEIQSGLTLVAAMDRFLVVLRDVEKVTQDLRLVVVDQSWRRMLRVKRVVSAFAMTDAAYSSLEQKLSVLTARGRSKAAAAR